MHYVAQTEKMGCGPACIAMVLGESYERATCRFNRDFDVKGLSNRRLDRMMMRLGYSVRRLFPEKYMDWPPKPFAPIHICRVRTTAMHGRTRIHHFVVMDEHGVIYDPEWPGEWLPWDYHRVLDVAGLFKTSDLTK